MLNAARLGNMQKTLCFDVMETLIPPVSSTPRPIPHCEILRSYLSQFAHQETGTESMCSIPGGTFIALSV